jgi:hypothetical protein
MQLNVDDAVIRAMGIGKVYKVRGMCVCWTARTSVLLHLPMHLHAPHASGSRHGTHASRPVVCCAHPVAGAASHVARCTCACARTPTRARTTACRAAVHTSHAAPARTPPHTHDTCVHAHHTQQHQARVNSLDFHRSPADHARPLLRRVGTPPPPGLHHTPYDPYDIRHTTYDHLKGISPPYEPRVSPVRHTPYDIRHTTYDTTYDTRHTTRCPSCMAYGATLPPPTPRISARAHAHHTQDHQARVDSLDTLLHFHTSTLPHFCHARRTTTRA